MPGFRILSIGDIPVHVNLWFGFLLLLWMQNGLVEGLTWGIAVVVSILVHELGHALVAKRYRLNPKILLHGWGGLCYHDRAERDRHDVLIIAAGPLAGLLLGVVVFLLSLFVVDLIPEGRPRSIAELAVEYLLYVNIFWSFVNLLPIWPLDGGQLFRIGLLHLIGPKSGDRITHVVALAFLGFGLLVAITMQSFFLGALCGLNIWQNIQALRGEIATGPVRSRNKRGKEVLAQAKKAYADGNYREAARLCHVMRDEDQYSGESKEMWAILGSSTARLGDHEEALSYLNRAPDRPDVTEARIECYYALGMDDELAKILGSSAFQKLPATRQREIREIVAS
jgi:stage IV sporulation protein FB